MIPSFKPNQLKSFKAKIIKNVKILSISKYELFVLCKTNYFGKIKNRSWIEVQGQLFTTAKSTTDNVMLLSNNDPRLSEYILWLQSNRV